MSIIPYFEVSGKRYEVMITRTVQAEYDKLSRESVASKAEKQNAAIAQIKVEEFRDVAMRYKEAKEAYFDDITNADKKAKYKAYKELYEQSAEEFAKDQIGNESIARIEEIGIEILRKVAILGLTEKYEGLTYEKAEEIWNAFEAERGKAYTSEWLMALSSCIYADDEGEENSFLSAMKAKAQQKAEYKKNISRVKK